MACPPPLLQILVAPITKPFLPVAVGRTNACCSHPLHRETELDGVAGVKVGLCYLWGADAASVNAMVKFDLGLGSVRATLPFFFSPSPGIRFSLVNRAAPVPPPHTHFFFFLRTSPCTERCGAEAGSRARNQGGGRAGGGLYLPHPHPLHGCLRYGVQRRAWT